MILRGVAVFAAMVAVDYAWARYTVRMVEKKVVGAANWSVAIVGLGAFTTINYVNDKTMLIPAVLGAWVGTALAIKYDKKA